MGPYIFYRVEDEDSRARYFGDDGLLAEDTETWVNFRSRGPRLLEQVEMHLDWGNRCPTPFISAYCDEGVALREARRRAQEGREDVRLYTIDMRESDERREFRNIRGLAERLGFDIPDCAWSNSEYEYIFLHHVPDSAIVACSPIEW